MQTKPDPPDLVTPRESVNPSSSTDRRVSTAQELYPQDQHRRVSQAVSSLNPPSSHPRVSEAISSLNPPSSQQRRLSTTPSTTPASATLKPTPTALTRTPSKKLTLDALEQLELRAEQKLDLEHHRRLELVLRKANLINGSLLVTTGPEDDESRRRIVVEYNESEAARKWRESVLGHSEVIMNLDILIASRPVKRIEKAEDGVPRDSSAGESSDGPMQIVNLGRSKSGAAKPRRRSEMLTEDALEELGRIAERRLSKLSVKKQEDAQQKRLSRDSEVIPTLQQQQSQKPPRHSRDESLGALSPPQQQILNNFRLSRHEAATVTVEPAAEVDQELSHAMSSQSTNDEGGLQALQGKAASHIRRMSFNIQEIGHELMDVAKSTHAVFSVNMLGVSRSNSKRGSVMENIEGPTPEMIEEFHRIHSDALEQFAQMNTTVPSLESDTAESVAQTSLAPSQKLWRRMSFNGAKKDE
ncbi:hypothetical protein HDU98_010576 [Podochytrium sp. JEL0797]|nr:hypothetical protein HDU98_010576 [Podochytrium sp. JEL0797]